MIFHTSVLFSTILLLSLSLPGLSFAQTTTTQTATSQYTITPSSIKQTQLQRSLNGNMLKDRALKEIDRRITSLTNAIERINSLTKISDLAKQEMTTQIQAEIDSLAELRTKIETETDETVIRTDAKSIVTSYRIYALFIPKIMTLTAAEGMLALSDTMLSFQQQLLTAVSERAASGEDVSALEQLLTDAEESITEAQEQAQSAIDTVSPLTPEGYPGNKTQIQTARQSLRNGRLALISAKDSLKEVLQSLRQTQASADAMYPSPALGQGAMKKTSTPVSTSTFQVTTAPTSASTQ